MHVDVCVTATPRLCACGCHRCRSNVEDMAAPGPLSQASIAQAVAEGAASAEAAAVVAQRDVGTVGAVKADNVRAVDTAGAVGASFAVQRVNWKCPDCGHNNYATRMKCQR